MAETNILIYQGEDGKIRIETRLEDEKHFIGYMEQTSKKLGQKKNG